MAGPTDPAALIRHLVPRGAAKNPQLTIGLALLVGLLATVALAPLIVSRDPTAIDLASRFAAPGGDHPLGADEFGRDVLTRVVYGSRTSLGVATGAVALAFVMGVTVGLVAGYLGRYIDLALMRLNDVLLAIPSIMIALGIVGVVGPSETSVMVALGIAFSAPMARVTRSAVVSVRSQAYVEAAQVMGASGPRVVREEIVPNILPMLAVQVTTALAFGILDEATLGFLGMGVQPPEPSWGSMLTTGRQYFFQSPYIALFAGLAVLIAVFCVNLLGDGLRDHLDPRDRLNVG